jgi:hypothetical protein
MKVELNNKEYEVKFDLDFVAEARVDNENYETKMRRLIRNLRIGELARVRQNSQAAIWQRVDARRNDGTALKNVAARCW